MDPLAYLAAQNLIDNEQKKVNALIAMYQQDRYDKWLNTDKGRRLQPLREQMVRYGKPLDTAMSQWRALDDDRHTQMDRFVRSQNREYDRAMAEDPDRKKRIALFGAILAYVIASAVVIVKHPTINGVNVGADRGLAVFICISVVLFFAAVLAERTLSRRIARSKQIARTEMTSRIEAFRRDLCLPTQAPITDDAWVRRTIDAATTIDIDAIRRYDANGVYAPLDADRALTFIEADTHDERLNSIKRRAREVINDRRPQPTDRAVSDATA